MTADSGATYDPSLRYALVKALLMRDLGLLLLRIVAGLTLAAHGYPKLFGGPGKRPPRLLATAMGPNYPAAVERSGPGFAAALEKMGVPNPQAAATASGLTEFAGGLALAAGFLTRPGFEFPLLLGTVALSLGFIGPGSLSIDQLLGSKGS